MARQRKGDRVHGPYQRGNGWRVVVVIGGTRSDRTYPTEAEAAAVASAARRQLGKAAATVTEALEAYEHALLERGLKARSIVATMGRLRSILGPAMLKDTRDITPPVAADLYARLVRSGVAVDTHRGALVAVKSWSKWCVSRRLMPANPFLSVEGVGRRKAGEESKPPLTLTEARALLATCLAQAGTPHAGAIATMAYLLLGCRASELLDRQVRDLDDDGRLLWIRRAKTRAGSRRLEVPEILRPHLLALTAGKGAGEPLFGQTRQWAFDWAKEMCRRAGVPEVGPHTLRGTHATLATMAGATGELVAAGLGHASAAVTDRHYIQPSERRIAVQRSSWRVLSGGKA